MNIETNFVLDPVLLAENAGKYLQEVCDKDVLPTLLLVSGGSAMEILSAVSFAHGELITIMMLDERYDSENLHSNFLSLQKSPFFERALALGVTFIDTSVINGERLDALVGKINTTLHSWKASHANGRIIAVLGIGDDGHTAGIMPFPEEEQKFNALFNDDAVWVVGYDASGKNPIPLRATVTLSFLRSMVDVAIIYVGSESKHAALTQVFAEEGDIAHIPARIFREMKSVKLFTTITL